MTVQSLHGAKYQTVNLAQLYHQMFILLSLIHISEPTRQAEISYAVFCLKKKNLRAHETDSYLVCLLLLEKKKRYEQNYPCL